MQTLSIVTGAASGIGRAAAERLVARGDRVLLLEIDEAGGKAAAAEPGEVAAAIEFFSGEDASFITGQVLPVSGGLTMAG